MTKYIGWVPTAGGRLSYSIIGDSSHPTLAETANVADNKKRRILCLQKRNLLDSSLPIFKNTFARLFLKTSGSFHFFLNAESSNDFSSENLKGRLYLFHKDSLITTDIQKCIHELKTAITKLNKFNTSSSSTDIDSFYLNEIQSHLKSADNSYLFCADFDLNRDGIVKIDFNGAPADLEHIICAQFFFFLKDIAHRHQHHHPKTDTILDVYREDNPHWPDQVLRALYKKVLDFKRSSNQGVYSSALGVLAYIGAFRKICNKNGYSQNCIMAGREDADLSESIKIRQDELRYNLEQNKRITNVITTSAISIIGVLLALSSLSSIVEPPIKITSEAHLLSFVADRFINYPIEASLFILIGIIGITFTLNWECILRDRSRFKDIARLIQGGIKNPVIAGILMLIISAGLAYLARFIFSL